MNEINASPQHSVQYESVVQYSFSFYSGILHSGIGFQILNFDIFGELYISIGILGRRMPNLTLP